jgi:hypothetical protein
LPDQLVITQIQSEYGNQELKDMIMAQAEEIYQLKQQLSERSVRIDDPELLSPT